MSLVAAAVKCAAAAVAAASTNRQWYDVFCADDHTAGTLYANTSHASKISPGSASTVGRTHTAAVALSLLLLLLSGHQMERFSESHVLLQSSCFNSPPRNSSNLSVRSVMSKVAMDRWNDDSRKRGDTVVVVAAFGGWEAVVLLLRFVFGCLFKSRKTATAAARTACPALSPKIDPKSTLTPAVPFVADRPQVV